MNQTQALGNVLFGPDRLAEQALAKGGPTPLVAHEIEGQHYAVVVAPLRGQLRRQDQRRGAGRSLSDVAMRKPAIWA